MRVTTVNKRTEGKEICYEVINHLTFWIKLLFGDIVLIILNGPNTLKRTSDMLDFPLYLLRLAHCLGASNMLVSLNFVNAVHYTNTVPVR